VSGGSREDKAWAYHLRTKFGITPEEYDAQLVAQGGVCAICGRPPKTKRLNVDHDHRTGRLRGLLEYWCNKFVVGAARVTPEQHRRAADYLESPPWAGEPRFAPPRRRRRGKRNGKARGVRGGRSARVRAV